MSQGDISLADILAALEWRATLLPLLTEANLGDMVLIDLRGITRDAWEADPRLSLPRGIVSLRAPPRPLWFMQLAGQRVEDWGLPNDRPIFTQHTPKQFSWMMWQGSMAEDWPDFYAQRCGLDLSPQLRQKCREAKSANE